MMKNSTVQKNLCSSATSFKTKKIKTKQAVMSHVFLAKERKVVLKNLLTEN